MWQIAKWPVLAAVVVLILALLYYATPNATQPKSRWNSLGAVLALVILGIATARFGLYVANFSNDDRTYGSLAGIIVFLLWVWSADGSCRPESPRRSTSSSRRATRAAATRRRRPRRRSSPKAGASAGRAADVRGGQSAGEAYTTRF